MLPIAWVSAYAFARDTEEDVMSDVIEWQRWAKARDEQIGAEYGPLSLTALHWLSDEDQNFPGVPGSWRAEPAVADGESSQGDSAAIAAAFGTVTVTADSSEGIEIDGRVVSGSVRVSTESDIQARVGDVIVEIIERDGSHAIRVRDPKAPARLAFTTLPRYDFDPAWRLTARFDALVEPREITVGSVVDGITHQSTVGGEIAFTVDGSEHRLTAFGDVDHLWILFRDATSGVTTPGAARSLRVDRPAEDGTVVLDFNRASCLPCAFNDYSTCPLPPPNNRLPIPVHTGERSPE
ncbi:DUF1684 domain-containing protein [Stackebrandtia soli]